jgi:hypothetical protein
MICATTAMPMPEIGPSVNHKWIKANAIAAAIYAGIGIVTFATDKLLGLHDPATGMLLRGIGGAIVFVAMVLPLAVYAVLTGAVLGEKLPRFSRRGWIAMHVGMGGFCGIVAGVMTLFGTASNGAATGLPSQTMVLLGVLIITFVFGPILGAAIGGLQALVLRRAAAGTGVWVLWSMIATAAMLLGVMLAALLLASPGMDPAKTRFVDQLTMQAVLFAGSVLAAVIMLPAVKRLTPRG